MRGTKLKNTDPLFVLFEHHMLTKSYEDSAAFTKEVAAEYLSYLDSTTAHIPMHIRTSVLEDLEAEAHEMLIKKMYGCAKSMDYANYGKVTRVQKNEELSTFEFQAPVTKPENEPDSGDEKKE